MSMQQLNKTKLTSRVSYLISLGLAAKFVVDTTVQFFNPFLTIVAAGFGISALAMGRLVALRSMTGLIAPALGSLADRIGYRNVMQISLFIGGLGMVLTGFSGNIVLLAVSMILVGVGQAGFTPNLHAYLSSRLPYHKRARGLGMVEYSWALAGMGGLLAAGYLIELYGWRAPFFILGALFLFFSALLGTLPSEAKTEKKAARQSYGLKDIRTFFYLGPLHRSAWAAIILHALGFFASTNIMIIHGGWLEAEYGLGPASLGKVALVIGSADLIGCVIVSIAVDAIGKKRSVGIGVAGSMIGYILIPLLNRSLFLAVASLALMRGFFEFATVSNFPLLSEQYPANRGKVLSLSMTFGLFGATAASITGPWAYFRFGVWGISLISLSAAIIALCLLIFLVKEHHQGDSKEDTVPESAGE
jgi:predicted MFS family arabinose efflux permease